MNTLDDILRGVLPDTTILSLIDAGFIQHASPNTVQPASLDIRLDLNNVYEVERFYLPREGEKVNTVLQKLRAKQVRDGYINQHKRYIIKTVESFNGLPFYMKMSPKSSPGRLFTLSRLVTDEYCAYDEAYPTDQIRTNWVSVIPSFDLSLSETEPISQMRFFKGSAFLNRKDLDREIGREKFIFPPEDPQLELYTTKPAIKTLGDEIATNLLTVDFSCDIIGYKTKRTQETIYLVKRDLDWQNFFEPIYRDQLKDGYLELEMNVGYLFGSFERIKLPAHLAAEVILFTEKYGDHRTHFAGYIDPWFGSDMPTGNSITFEVIAFEKGACLRHRQPIAELRYEYMSSNPQKLYQGNYRIQTSGPQLPKYFKKLAK